MPTAGRLAGAVTFMALAYIATRMMLPLFPVGTAPARFLEVNLFAACLAGWITVGQRAGRGVVAAVGVGITGLAVFLFWMFFLHALDEMLEEAFHKSYHGPVEAIVAVFEIMVQLGQKLLLPPVLSALFVWQHRRRSCDRLFRPQLPVVLGPLSLRHIARRGAAAAGDGSRPAGRAGDAGRPPRRAPGTAAACRT